MTKPTEHAIWLELAELFFLDTEPSDRDFHRTAQTLTNAGWSREQTQSTLIELIAPVAGANLGYLIFPVIGAWAGFDQDDLCAKIERHRVNRAKRAAFMNKFADRHARYMLKKLDMPRLLNLIQ